MSLSVMVAQNIELLLVKWMLCILSPERRYKTRDSVIKDYQSRGTQSTSFLGSVSLGTDSSLNACFCDPVNNLQPRA